MAKLDIIACEQDNNTLVSKYYVEDFYAKSVLFVNESQEALFYKDGQALDLFQSGRHTLEVSNLPLFKKFFTHLFKGDRLAFPCNVIFINKVCVLDMGWGTDTPITVEDPRYHRIVSVRANGQMGIKIDDSRKFVVKVVGQLNEFTVEEVKKIIKGMVMVYVKETIATAIIMNGASVLEVSTQLSRLSQLIQENVDQKLEPLGLKLENFFVGAIVPDENDMMVLRQAKDREADMDMESMAKQRASIREIDAEAYKQNALGFTYQEGRAFDVMDKAAQNQGAGGAMMNAGMGLGMGLGMAKGFGGMMDGINNTTAHPQAQANPQAQAPQTNAATKLCPNCGAQVPANAKFCTNCGNKFEEQPPKPSFCPECGGKIEGEQKFCPHCGHKLG